jgi:transcriptional regulator with XRE-family HTH domain
MRERFMSDDSLRPAVQGRLLRTALRQARDDAHLTLDQVATALDVSLSKVQRIESGAVKVSTTDLRALLDLYKITDQVRIDELVAMARVAKKPSWWSSYKEVASQRYLEFVEFEQAATATLNYQPLWVPGLLQTRDYAAEIIRRLGPESVEHQQGLFDFRMKRQELLEAADLPSLSFVLDESVLRRQVGSKQVMHTQLGRLSELAGRSSITIQVRPFSNGLVRRMQAPFVIHQLEDAVDLDVLYLETPVGDTIVADDNEEIGRYRSAFEQLRSTSLSSLESRTFLKEVADSFH